MKPFFGGNWKMQKLPAEVGGYFSELKSQLAEAKEEYQAVVFASFPLIPGCIEQHSGPSSVSIGAQNCHWEMSGTFTGEVSPELLKALGVSSVIVGHSERRKYFSESDEYCEKKVKAVLSRGLTALLCVGETWDERESGLAKSVVSRQLEVALAGVASLNPGEKLVVAYEPVWAISAGPGSKSKPAESSDIEEMHQLVHDILVNLGLGQSTRVIYGASANPDNVAGIMSIKYVDGVLPGAASLDPEKFGQMILRGSKAFYEKS